MSKTKTQKLAIAKETLRKLSDKALAQAGGAGGNDMTSSTGSAYICCARDQKPQV